MRTKKQFSEKDDIQFFVCQLTVSNLSLTLIKAKHIVFLQLPQTWSDFEQAMDRIHRYGQIAPEVTTTAFVLLEAGDDDMLINLQKWKDQSDMVLDGRHLPPIPWEWIKPKGSELDKIKLKIVALANMTVANSCTEHEAETAAAMAGRLLAAYNLTMDECALVWARLKF
jgi:hypothetical protein